MTSNTCTPSQSAWRSIRKGPGASVSVTHSVTRPPHNQEILCPRSFNASESPWAYPLTPPPEVVPSHMRAQLTMTMCISVMVGGLKRVLTWMTHAGFPNTTVARCHEAQESRNAL